MVKLKKTIWVGLLLGLASLISLRAMDYSAAKKPEDPFITQLESLTTRQDDTPASMAEAIISVQNASADKNKVLVPWLLKKESILPAPFTMQLGTRLFLNKHKDGLRWYMVGRIRSTYDGKRCGDTEAEQEAAFLGDLYGAELLKYANAHMEEFLLAWQEAINWEKNHAYPANPTWLCAMASSPNVTPSKDWPSIRANTIQRMEVVLKKRQENLINSKSKNLSGNQ